MWPVDAWAHGRIMLRGPPKPGRAATWTTPACEVKRWKGSWKNGQGQKVDQMAGLTTHVSRTQAFQSRGLPHHC